MTSKTFVHTHCAVVKDNILLHAVDLRRRDADEETAFSYFANRMKSYSSFDASAAKLDITFFHVSDASNKTFTRLQVFDAETCCERCAVERGQEHESYCDAEKRVVESTSESTKKSALDLVSKLKLSAAQSSSVKSESAASAQAQTPVESAAKSEDAKSEDAAAKSKSAAKK